MTYQNGDSEDRLIARLRTKLNSRAAMKAECTQFVKDWEPLARKAYWAYSHFLLHSKAGQPRSHSFELEYLDAWCDHYISAVQASAQFMAEMPSTTVAQKLLVTWHFPEYPLFLPAVRLHNILALIAQEAEWMISAAGRENLYLFRPPATSLGIVRAFKEGRPVAAMLDYCYDETSVIVSDFLGYPARTPGGIFVLAQRFGYQIEVLSFRDGKFVIVDSFGAADGTIPDSVQRVNQAIENEILRDPVRWLLWPSVDRRWIGVDYELASSQSS
jgi:hypothetical protein